MQDAINEGMMEIMGVIAKLTKHIPIRKGPSLSDLAQDLPRAQNATQEPGSPTDKREDSK
jgi:hypothetical protein